MRLLAHGGFGVLTLVVVGAAWLSAVGPMRIAPVPVVIIALYLGLTSRGHLASAVVTILVVGYIGDVLSGSPRGLTMTAAALTTIGGHIAQGRFVLRGLVAGAIVSALAASFFLLLSAAMVRAVGADHGSWFSLPVLAGCAGITGFLGPVQLGLHRRIDARLARTQRERDASLEGVSAA